MWASAYVSVGESCLEILNVIRAPIKTAISTKCKCKDELQWGTVGRLTVQQWVGAMLYSSDSYTRSELALKPFPWEIPPVLRAKCSAAKKISPKLLHTEFVQVCCWLFQGTCVFNNTFSSNIPVPSRTLCYVTQLLPYCMTNFLLLGSVCWKCNEIRPALLQLST